MNEKIKELSDKALNGETFYYTAIPIGFVDKFAELIINECIDIANDTRYEGKIVANRIKFVFGVEE